MKSETNMPSVGIDDPVLPIVTERSVPSPQAGQRRYIVAALMMVMVLASMEQTVTSTAMPTIIGDLRGLENYSWVASIYLLNSPARVRAVVTA